VPDITANRISIGPGFYIKLADYNGVVVGLHEWHPDKRNPTRECQGFVFFDVPTEARCEDTPVWKVQSMAPLTLVESLLCRTCGNHGYIKEGRWVPA
jgi:hypothetical protein